MLKVFISASVFAFIFLTTVAYPQDGGGGGGGGNQCAQYQSQCQNGSQGASQGAQGGQAVFPNNPMPTSSSFNQTAAEQLPYCQGMAQACESQQAQPTQAPSGGS